MASVCFRVGRCHFSGSRRIYCERLVACNITARSRAFSTAPPRHSDVRPETSQVSNMMDIGTRTAFSEEHDIFRQNVRKFMREEVAPRREEFDNAGIISKDVWQKAGSLGLLGTSIPEDLGGVGADFLSAAIVQEEIAYSGYWSFGGTVVHSEIVMPYICRYGNAQQIRKYIPDMTAGRRIGAIAMTEPGAGSDLQGVVTSAKRDDSGWLLSGSKTFITNGINSDVVIVVAKTDVKAKSAAHGISLFLVDADRDGFSRGRNLKKIGLKGGDTAELFFDNVRLTDDDLLGKENKGFYYLMNELPQERLSIAVLAVASCEWMFEETRTYVKERKAFGRTLANLQTIQHKLAEMKTNICIARTFVDKCMQLHVDGKLDSQMASMAKYWTTDLQTSVADQCLQLHGGMGYMWEMPIARAFVDSRVQPIYGGSNEIMKELIARHVVSE